MLEQVRPMEILFKLIDGLIGGPSNPQYWLWHLRGEVNYRTNFLPPLSHHTLHPLPYGNLDSVDIQNGL